MRHSLVGRVAALSAVCLVAARIASAQPAGVGATAAGPAQGAAPSPLSLEEAVAGVLDHAPLRRMALARLDANRRSAGAAGAWPNPSIEVRAENWTFGAWQWSASADPFRVPVDFLTVVTQPIDLGGKRGAQRGLAEGEVQQASAELQRIERSLALQAVRFYLDVIRTRDEAAALAENQRSLETVVSTLSARVQEGVAPASDLARFRVESARVASQVLRTRIELERSAASLATLMGIPDVDPARLTAPAPPVLPESTEQGLVARVVEASAEVAAARARARVAEGASALERSRRAPALDVAGGYKRTAGINAAVLGVQLTLPLFDRNTRAVAQAAAEALATGFEATAVEERVAGEGRVAARHAMALADRAAHVDRELLEPADIVRTAARAAFREGASEILTLVDAERVYLEAHREALQLRLDALAAAFELRIMLGEEIHR